MGDKAKKEVKGMGGESKNIGPQMLEIGQRGAKVKGQRVAAEVYPMERNLAGRMSEDNTSGPVIGSPEWAAAELQKHARTPDSNATVTLADGTVVPVGDVKIDIEAQQRAQERAARGVTRPVGIRGPRFSGG